MTAGIQRVLILWICGMCGLSCLAAQEHPATVRVFNHRPGLTFLRFVDPRENAFSAEVPRNWKNAGGLYRFASVDTRGALESISPEGTARVSWGDADLPPFTVPNQMLAMAGFREGAWYSPGYGVRMMVRRYEAGTVFAEEYVRAKVAPQLGCSAPTITARAHRADLTQAINALYARFGAMGQMVREDAGEVSFTCMRQGQAWHGYYLAVTLISSTAGSAIWHVENVLGYAALESNVPVAQTVMLHLARSVQLNPEWERMQQGVTMATSKIVARTNEEISDTIRKTFENKWKTEDEIFRNDANARRGVTDLVDPETGESWNVENRSRHYWRKPGSDVIVGTETYDAPGIGYQPLRQY